MIGSKHCEASRLDKDESVALGSVCAIAVRCCDDVSARA